MLSLSSHTAAQIAFFILPIALYLVCETVKGQSIPEYFLYETPYSTAATVSLSAVTDPPIMNKQPPNRYMYRIRTRLQSGDKLTINGILRNPPAQAVTTSSDHVALNHTYVYRLPQNLRIGDNLTISGFLQSNPKKLRIKLLHRELEKFYNVDYQNMALRFTALMGDGYDDFKMAAISEDTVVNSWHQRSQGKIFYDNTFKFSLGVNRRSKSEKDTIFDVYVNDKLIQTLEGRHDMDRIGYLQISGHYSTVNNVNFYFG